MKNITKFIRTSKDVFGIFWEMSPKITLGITITQIILALSNLVNAYVFSFVLDRLISFVSERQASLNTIMPIIFLYGGVMLFFSLVDLLRNYSQSLLGAVSTHKLRLKQTDYLVSLGTAQMENAELTNKSTRYSEVYYTFEQQLSQIIGLISLIVSTVVGGIILLRFIPFQIFLFILLFIFKYMVNSRFMKKVWRLSLENTEYRRSSQFAVGTLSEPGEVKELLISGGTTFLRKKYTDFINWYYGLYFPLRTKWFGFEFLQTIAGIAIFAFSIVIVIQKGVAGAITVGAITFYVRALLTFSDQLDSLSYRIARAQESSIRIQDALELFEQYKPEEDGLEELEFSSIPPEIKLENISFTYPNGKHPVISALSLTIKPGEKIAIVGENGAGKTTLVKLLTRIYKPQEGVIWIGNKRLNDLKLSSWYKNIGVLFQDFNMYGFLTASENVGIGKIVKGSFNEKRVVEALKKADALDFVNKYPKKLNQVLSERFRGGIRPSGGQWQKLAIARFFYRNAPVLIMDEPTASIDAVAEARIFDNIYKFMNGKTVIIISHRFSTVRNADRILVLDKGKIIEDGTHEELLTHGGKYATSFNLQAKGYN